MTTVALGALEAILLLAYVSLLVAFAPSLGLAIGLITAGRLALMWIAHGRMRELTIESQIATSESQNATAIAFVDPESQKALNRQADALRQFVAAKSREVNALAREQGARLNVSVGMYVSDGLALATILLVGGRAVISGSMPLGTFTTFVAVVFLLARPTQSIILAGLELARLPSNMDRVDDVLDTLPAPCGDLAPNSLSGLVTFEQVSFRYGAKGAMLLDNVSFHVEAGERVAIVGSTGTGKSTIIRLILGLIRPTSGRVLIDGRDVQAYDTGALRRRIGTVLAGSTFIDESLAQNIALGSEVVDLELMHLALQSASIGDLVHSFSETYWTRLGPGAHGLSGGQKQRLLLARALLKQPDILLLDEASSALDPLSEAKVLAGLDGIRCTQIVVGHRLSALRLATRLILLDEGRVKLDGAFDELKDDLQVVALLGKA